MIESLEIEIPLPFVTCKIDNRSFILGFEL